MRVFRPAAVLVLCLASVSGCTGGVNREAVRAWVGRPAAALEKDWGPPTREVQDGDQRILVYEEIEKRSPPAFEGAASAFKRGDAQSPEGSYRGPAIYVRSYLFWVNRAGTIVHSDVRAP